jgi:putative ABC transport system substrate-binding protein
MRRRDFISALGGVAVWPLAVHAQQPRIPVIGVLWPGTASPPSPRMESFRQGLRESGFVEGQNIAIQLRWAERGLEQLPELAAELVHLKVDVIHVSGDLASLAAQKATATIPIIALGDDLLGAGLITSLSRPGGNMSGLTILSPELSAKRLEVLRDMIPGLSCVASLWDSTTGISQLQLTESAADSLNIKLKVLEVRRREALAGAFELARGEKAEALNVFSSPFLASIYRDIIELAAEHRLPAIYQWKEHAEAGGLISYGPSLSGMWRQNAMIVAKVLRGAKPADLPVEQPTTFELVINLKTAKALGITIPLPLFARADEVVEYLGE